jgi:selenocysteine lyase/cysteine desulfurase
VSWKPLFSRALAADPDRLHFAAHSHHLWPDASFEGHVEAWNDAALLADRKWARVMGPVWEEAQRHIADELRLPDPATITFSANTHDFIIRIVSALPDRPLNILATDGEFHSFRRQMARWSEDGRIRLTTASPDSIAQVARARIADLEALAALANPDGPWLVIDGYHSFMAIPTDLSSVANRIFFTSGGYKYAMSGEGLGFLHAPPGFAPRPAVTGWFAEFEDLTAAPGAVGYAPDGRRFLGATFDPTALYRFNAVRRMMARENLTTARVCDHVTALQHRFTSAVAMPHMTLLNPPGNAPGARFLAFRGEDAARLHHALMDRNVITDLRADVLRIGFAAYHDEVDVDRLARIVSHI